MPEETDVRRVRAAEEGERYRTVIRVRDHEVVSDEPRERGGGDTGPTPVELLLGSLAACKVITMRLYAERKGWPLASTSVEVRHRQEKRPREGGGFDRLDRFEVAYRIEGEGLDEAMRTRLLEIADKCPVHRILEGDVEIVHAED